MKTTNFESISVVEKYRKYLLVNKYFGKPAFLKFIGNVRGLKILDCGCGTGHLTRDLQKRGAICTGIDKSENIIEIAKSIEAKEKAGIKYYHLDAANLKGIRAGAFDKIIMFQVILNVPRLNELKSIFSESRRVLKNNGEIVFTNLHPLLIQNYKDNLREIILPKYYDYYKNGITYTARHLTTDFKWMKFRNSHWTLEFLAKILKENGLAITEIEEPEPKKDNLWKYFSSIIKMPHYIFFKARVIS